MPTYQPSIPTGTVPFNQDYLNIQGNFQQLNIAYGVDHVPFSDVSGVYPPGISGFHTVVHLMRQTIDPATVSLCGEIYTKTAVFPAGGDGQLFFKTPNGGVQQISGNRAASNGFGWFSGILLQWGKFNPNTTTSVTFPVEFPTSVFSLQLTGTASNNSVYRVGIATGTLGTAGFTFQGSVDPHWNPIYWLAIGV